MGAAAAEELGIAPGDRISIEKADGDVDDLFSHTEFTVSGLVNSPTYIASSQMGSTSLGTGSIELYLYVQPAAFADDLPYTVAYLSVPAARASTWETDAYDEAVAPVKERVEQAAEDISEKRWSAVVGDAQQELDDARADYEAERADAESDLEDARAELAEARSKLDNAAVELVTGRAQVDDAARQIEESEQQLREAEDEYAQGAAELEAQRAQFEQQAAGLDELSRAEGVLEQGRIAHHIEPLKAKPELGLTLTNVIFLSERNHRRVHAEYRKGGMAEVAMKATLRKALNGMGG